MDVPEELLEAELDALEDESLISPLDEATALVANKSQTEEHDSELFRHTEIEPGEIRLLEILPDTSEPFFHFGFKIFKRKEAPPYSAISYVWGSDEPACQIFLHDKIFLIRENLLACLSSVIQRKNFYGETNANGTFCGDYLWIDAICIDQTQPAERNEQVRRMDKVYANATTVLAWLGTAFEPGTGLLRSKNGIDFWTENINYLADRPYWYRRGRQWIRERDFFAKVPHRHNPLAAVAFERFGPPTFNLSLAGLLHKYGHKHCIDPRDRIYALLGCMESTERHSLEQYLPDYNLTYYETVIVALAHSRHFLVTDRLKHNHLLRELDAETADAVLNVSDILYHLIRGTDVFAEARKNDTKIQSQALERKVKRSMATLAQPPNLLDPVLLEDPYTSAKRLYFYFSRRPEPLAYLKDEAVYYL